MKTALTFVALLTAFCAWAQDPKADGERAMKGIESFTTMQMRTDPHYGVVEGELLKELDALLNANPPREWLGLVRQRYVALSEAAHVKEQDAIRAEESRIATSLGYGDAGWLARSSQLEEQLKTGKLGPRLHAMRMWQAAKVYHPSNDLLAQWRAAKVPIATDYELGNITRPQYEDRWQKVTATFLDRQAADDRQRAAINAQAAAEEYRAGMQSLQRQAPPTRPLRCTSSTSFGVTTTRCN